MSQSYTIIFNSKSGTQKNTVLSSTSVVLPTYSWQTYSMDWNLLPQGKYKCRFSFLSQVQTSLITIANSKIPQVYLNLGNSNIFEGVANIGVKNTTSQSIGILALTPLSNALSVLYADANLNQPFYIQRPTNNQMEIRILDSNATPAFYTDATALAAGTAPFCPHYVLTLYMELIG